jgi:radical SAM superfamily enzyme YgiQ (UPF0313 family)
MPTNVLLVYPVPSVSSPQKSAPLSILHVGEALKLAHVRGKSDDTYNVRYFDERYDPLPDLAWADVVGVSSMTGYQLTGAIRWLKAANQAGKRTILGGIHVTMQPEQCLAEDYVDSIVISEGEWAVLDAIHGGHKTIAKRGLDEGDHVSPVTPETLEYFKRAGKTGDTILLTSRGCPFRCGFCYIQQFFNRSWQSVDLDRWKADVLYLRDNAGLTKLEHGDDWIGRWDRAREIIKFLHDAGVEYRPSIRAHQVTDDVAREMAEMGIRHISVGMETGSQRMLKLTQKDIVPEHQVICAEALAKAGVWPLYYWITGFPTETPAEINETLDQADKLHAIHKGKVTQNFYAYTALPGSPLYELVDKESLPKTMAEWSTYSLNQTADKRASNLYHIGGLHFHRGAGDKTARNFPGLWRLLILPFEFLASLRWRRRWFAHYQFEKWAVEKLLRWASRRYERKTSGGRVSWPAKVEIMDWGVREGTAR